MPGPAKPVLYSFRRCPYAMRARMALAYSDIDVELREVVLRDKPEEMLLASPKGTVPVLVLPDKSVLEESLDIMLWAVSKTDPGGLYSRYTQDMKALVGRNDGPFKKALDRYKYPNRYEDENISRDSERETGAHFLKSLDTMLKNQPFLYGETLSLADIAIMPFVRQFANVDRQWFDGADWARLSAWLNGWLNAPLFLSVMQKYPQWKAGSPGINFPSLLEN